MCHGDAGQSVQGQEEAWGHRQAAGLGRPGQHVAVVVLTPQESQFIVVSSNRATAFAASGFQNLLILSPCLLAFLTALSF